MNKTGFFEEKPGVKSSTRLNSSIIIWCGLVMGFLCIILNKPDFIALPTIIIGIGSGQKVAQKAFEKINEKKSKNIDDNSDIN